MTATDNGVSMRPMAASDLEQIVRLDRTTAGEATTGFFERRLRAEQARPVGFF